MKTIVNVKINGHNISTEVDTGCPIILIGSQLYRKHFAKQHLKQVTRPLFDASHNRIKLLGSFSAKI